MTTRRLLTATTIGALALGAIVAVAPPAQAKACATSADRPIAIGSPKADVGDVGDVADAGSVEIRSECNGSAATQILTLPHPRAGDWFGSAITDVNLAFDGTDGLLIGIPRYDVGTAVDAGAIAAYHRARTGFVLDRIITQDTPGVPGAAQSGAGFGTSLAVDTDLDEGYTRTVRIGEPGLNVGSVEDAGGVVDLAYSTGPASEGFPPVGTPIKERTRLLTLNSPGIPWAAKAGDLFGAALGGRNGFESIGAPGRTVLGHPNAGAVLRSVSYRPSWVTQATSCVPGVPETGDRFGASLAGDWIGVPGEDLDGVTDAGMVNRYDGRGDCRTLSEKSTGFQGTLHAGDRFGATVLERFGYVDGGTYQPEFLAIGAPGADTSKGRDTGSISYVSEILTDYENYVLKVYAPGVTVGSHATPGAALGTSLGFTFATFSTPASGLLLGGAPGGRGRVYAFDLSAEHKLTYHHAYVPARTEPGTYGTGLLLAAT